MLSLKKIVQLLLCFLLACINCCCAGHAQGLDNGALGGHLRLADGSPASGVLLRFKLIAADSDDESTATATTDRTGSFGLLTLSAGVYRVEVSGPGIQGATRLQNVVVEESESTRVLLRLPALSVTPMVISGLPKQAVGPDELSARDLQQLPLADLEWESASRAYSFANDATAVDDAPGREQDGASDSAEAARRGGSQGGTTETASGTTFAGLPITQNTESVDGLSNEQAFRSGPRGATAGGPVSGSSSYGQGVVRSLRVLPRSFSAQYGNAAGNGLAVRTRGGFDHFRGGLFYLLRESAFAATNPYSVVTHYSNGAIATSLVKPQDLSNQFGGHLSLPLQRPNRNLGTRSRFLFASVEEQLRSNPVASSPSTPAFYALSPTQTALLRNRGVTAASQNTALNYLDSLSGAIDRHTDRTLAFLRLDAQTSRRDRVGATYALNHFRSPAGSSFDQNSEAVTARGRGSIGDRAIDVNVFDVNWTHTLTAHANNELQFQWARDLETELPRSPLTQEPAISPGGFAPQVSIQPDGFTYGTPSGLGRAAFPDEQRVQAADQLLYARGRHLFAIGGNWSRVNDRIAQLTNAEGSFLYDSGTTGGHAGGLVDWITDYTFNVNAYPNGGCPSIVAPVHDFCFRSFTQSFGGSDTSFVTNDFAGFAEDHFHVRSGLSLSVGVRYEYVLLPLPQAQNTALDAAFANVGGALAGATSSFPEDRNNFGPRLAVAWKPAHGEFGTLHVGYGAFYGRLTGATTHAALTETAMRSSTTQIRITPTTEVDCPQVAAQSFGYPCAFVSTPPAAVVQTSSALILAKSFRLPAVQRGSLLWERGIGPHTLLRAEYAASIATQLPGSTDINIAPATSTRSYVIQGGDAYPGLHTGQTFTVPLYTARRVSQYGPVTTVESNANSTYHAGTLEAQLRGLHSLEVRGNFTFSRAIDYGPQLGATPRQNGQFDPSTDGYDKGLSSLSFPVRFTGQLLYRSHVAGGNTSIRETLSGWQVASIAFAGSGAPYTYAIFGGTRLSGGRESINGSGGANYLPTVGRNTLRLPPRASVDLRLGREWKTGSFSVNVFAEAFNLLNQRNLARVETRAFVLGTPANSNSPTPLVFQDAATVSSEGLTTQPFGTPTSSTTAFSRERQAEFGVRLSF